ncbi:MAG TPA: DUF3164 family protein [Bacteroidales bacterium]|nr:DUF3164 family protein [Bacteroidales bacterium]
MRQKGQVWTDHKNNEVPTYAIRRVLKVEEKHSHKIAEAALLAEKYLRKVVELTREAYEEVFEEKCKDAKIYNHKAPTEGMSISAFDNSVEIKITKPDNVYFDPTYTGMVKEKFEEYFKSFEDNDAIKFLRDLVNDLLFSPKGSVDMNKVLRLRKHRDSIQSSRKINHNATLFIEAVDLFDKAIRTKPGTMGIYIDVKDEKGITRRIPLKYTDIQ